MPQPIPAPEEVKDPVIRRILEAVRTNINVAWGVSGRAVDRLVSVQDLVNWRFLNSSLRSRMTPASTSADAASVSPSTGLVSVSAAFSAPAEVGTVFLPLVLPAGAVVVWSFIDVQTSFSGGALASMGIRVQYDGANYFDIVPSSLLASAWSAGYHNGNQDFSATNAGQKTTSVRAVQVDVSGAAVTSGRFKLFLQYAMSEV